MTFAAFAATLMLAAPQAQALPDEVVNSTRAEVDSRSLNMAMLHDTSTSMGSTYNADVIPAAVAFLKKLPPVVSFSIWSHVVGGKELEKSRTREF
jgi:hypothetical protein